MAGVGDDTISSFNHTRPILGGLPPHSKMKYYPVEQKNVITDGGGGTLR